MPKFNYGTLQDGRTPGPEIPIEVHSPINGSLPESLLSIVDTGANVTCVPEAAIFKLEQWGDLDYSYRQVRGALGRSELKRFFKVYLTVAESRLSNEFEVLGLKKKYGILGRDALEHQIVILNGIKRRLIIRSSRL